MMSARLFVARIISADRSVSKLAKMVAYTKLVAVTDDSTDANVSCNAVSVLKPTNSSNTRTRASARRVSRR